MTEAQQARARHLRQRCAEHRQRAQDILRLARTFTLAELSAMGAMTARPHAVEYALLTAQEQHALSDVARDAQGP